MTSNLRAGLFIMSVLSPASLYAFDSPVIYLKGELPRLSSEFLNQDPVPLVVSLSTCEVSSLQGLTPALSSTNTSIKIQPTIIFPLVSEHFLPSPVLLDLEASNQSVTSQ